MPDNLSLLFLPPYSPELNPQEHLWDELHEKYFHNCVFDSIDALEDHLVVALRDLENSPDRGRLSIHHEDSNLALAFSRFEKDGNLVSFVLGEVCVHSRQL